MDKITFKLSGIKCKACTQLVSRKLAKLEGVSGVGVSMDGLVNISCEKPLKKTELETVIEQVGYKITEFIKKYD